MGRKNINSMTKKKNNKKSNFYKNKKVLMIDDTDFNKILKKKEFLKKNHMARKICLHTLLDTMIMILLDH